MKKKLMLCAILLLISIFLNSCGLLTNSLDGFFAEWERRSDPNVAIVNQDSGTICIDGKVLALDMIIDEYYGQSNSNIGTILAIVGDKIYGILEYISSDDNYYYNIRIYSVDIHTEQMEVLYQENVAPKNEELYRDGWGAYHVEQYYSCRNIVACDGAVIITYDIDTGKVEHKPPEEFTYPVAKYTIEDRGGVFNFDFDKIVIINGEEKRTITVEYMAERHEYVRRLLELGELKGFFGTVDPTETFFYDECVIDSKVYLTCNVLEKDGGSNGLVFSYDYEGDFFEFLYHEFVIDTPKLTVIPIE